ncbi:hypothetical protein H4Q26_003121 [Puccinia striiformis f. sp. tritici PST-130]|nr:hypothetical protein H4Q26_003121 [Puccinia striiformis f. sp. tritici PST-130]
MSFLIAPNQWDDFEQLFDKLVTDRYGPASDQTKGTNGSKALSTVGSHPVSKIQRPKMDVVETDSSIVVTTELPGAKKEDISIDLQNGRLSISGQTKASSEHSEGNVRVSERSFGSFSRTIAVPPGLTHDQVKAGFKDGVLEVTIPKVIPTRNHTKSVLLNSLAPPFLPSHSPDRSSCLYLLISILDFFPPWFFMFVSTLRVRDLSSHLAAFPKN